MMTEPGRPLSVEPSEETKPAGLDMEVLIGYLLLGGVLTSVTLLTAGLIWHWLRYRDLLFDYQIQGMNFFEFILDDLRPLKAGTLRPRSLVNLGIAALMLTPYVRVLFSLLYFAFARRNWKYTLFTGLVFSILTYSLFLR